MQLRIGYMKYKYIYPICRDVLVASKSRAGSTGLGHAIFSTDTQQTRGSG
jgi:hypothetical protein